MPMIEWNLLSTLLYFTIYCVMYIEKCSVGGTPGRGGQPGRPGKPGNGKRRGSCQEGFVCKSSGACVRGNQNQYKYEGYIICIVLFPYKF